MPAYLPACVFASQVILLNWRGTAVKDELLQKLSVLVDAAARIKPDEEEESKEEEKESSKVFGHLHIVMRDHPDTSGMYDLLFKQESGRAADKARVERNRIREGILESFESVSVWGLPSPIRDAVRLNAGEFAEADCTDAFLEEVGRLKDKMAEQLQVRDREGRAGLDRAVASR